MVLAASCYQDRYTGGAGHRGGHSQRSSHSSPRGWSSTDTLQRQGQISSAPSRLLRPHRVWPHGWGTPGWASSSSFPRQEQLERLWSCCLWLPKGTHSLWENTAVFQAWLWGLWGTGNSLASSLDSNSNCRAACCSSCSSTILSSVPFRFPANLLTCFFPKSQLSRDSQWQVIMGDGFERRGWSDFATNW